MAPILIGFVSGIAAAIVAAALGASGWSILLTYCGAGGAGMLIAGLWLARLRPEIAGGGLSWSSRRESRPENSLAGHTGMNAAEHGFAPAHRNIPRSP